MPVQLNGDKAFKYLLVVLGLILLIILISKIFFDAKFFALPAVEKMSQPLQSVEINWNVLREPLKVTLPEMQVTLEATPAITSPNTKVSLTANIAGPIEGQFVYRFDCNNDGKFDFPSADKANSVTAQKKMVAENTCSYEKAGTYRAMVEVEGKVTYYKGGQEVTESRKASAYTEVVVGDFSAPFKISSCDVSAKEGTTQKDSTFIFSVNIENSTDQLKYRWDFGDGAMSEERNPSYVYKEAGLYVPKVTVFDAKGRQDTCVVYSLLGLHDLSPFENIAPPKKEDIGRDNPFMPY
ncbi:MAG: PKD domain-containing protein [Candidatus Pacebacteria bacterium]|nr:PKD domain-containing protein [Candidatus Paceibacterota bacterium]